MIENRNRLSVCYNRLEFFYEITGRVKWFVFFFTSSLKWSLHSADSNVTSRCCLLLVAQKHTSCLLYMQKLHCVLKWGIMIKVRFVTQQSWSFRETTFGITEDACVKVTRHVWKSCILCHWHAVQPGIQKQLTFANGSETFCRYSVS